MYSEYPKVVRISLQAYSVLSKAKNKRGLSMAKILSEYIVQNNKNDNHFSNWLRDYKEEKMLVSKIPIVVDRKPS